MDDWMKAYTFNFPEYLPVTMGLYQPTWVRHGEALEELVLSHPNLFPNHKKGDWRQIIASRPPVWQYELGRHTDHWGCVWDNIKEGHDSICVAPALPDLDKVDELPIPEQNVGLEHGILFLRLTYLRGYEECMIDFAEERPEFYRLIEKVMTYNMRQVKIALDYTPPGGIIGFADDLGMQTSLPTGPEKWRKILGPCFKRMFAPCKEKGTLVSLHSDGHIWEIIPDLHDCGLDIINPQFRANGLDNLKTVTRGSGRNRMAVHLDMDRQLYPFATPSQLEDHVMECVEALALPEGGLSLYVEVSEDIPLVNIKALAEALEKARLFYRR